MRSILGPLTWAYVIIIGVILITPGGIGPIAANAAIRVVLGAFGIALGVGGFVLSRRQPALG